LKFIQALQLDHVDQRLRGVDVARLEHARGHGHALVGLRLAAALEAQQAVIALLQVLGRRIHQLDAIDLRRANGAEPCGTTDTVPSLPMVTCVEAECSSGPDSVSTGWPLAVVTAPSGVTAQDRRPACRPPCRRHPAPR
jgi:hypothetical protein